MEKYPESRYSLKYLCCHINILAHTTSPGLTYRQPLNNSLVFLPLVFFIRRGGTIYILLDFIFKKKKSMQENVPHYMFPCSQLFSSVER